MSYLSYKHTESHVTANKKILAFANKVPVFNMPVFTCACRKLLRKDSEILQHFVLLHATRDAHYARYTLLAMHTTRDARYARCTLRTMHATRNARYARCTLRAMHATRDACYARCTLRVMHATRDARCARRTLAVRASGGCAVMFHSCTLALRARSPASRLRRTAAPLRLRVAPYADADTRILCRLPQ
jgi:hypothetical protein